MSTTHRGEGALVSPTSIRSRILKGDGLIGECSAVIVSPTSIRSRILKDTQVMFKSQFRGRFTHVDPFEDTERRRLT